MKSETFEMATAAKIAFEKLGIRLPTKQDQAVAKDVRIPVALIGDDMLFGA